MKRFLLATALCSLIASTPAFCFYQSGPQHDRPQEGGQAPAPGGVNTGGAHAAVYDQEHRPITAGGFVKTGPVIFEDISRKAGLDNWTHTMGTPEKRFIIEANGSGVALIDYDNDGWLDIYLVNGSTYDALAGKRPAPRPRSSTTITMEPLPMSPTRLALRTNGGASGLPWPTMITTAGPIFTFPISERTGSTTTITMEPSRT
jgi:hypothetical protein